MNRFESFTGGVADKVASPLMWLMALMLTVFVAGCGGGSSVLGPSGPSIPPKVTFVAPLANAIGVPINTKIITATFTKTMDPTTLTPVSFTLVCPAGTPITGTVAYVAAGNVATLTLPATTSLPPNTACTATVTAAAKDATGVSLTSNFIWLFTTGAAPDTTPPTVTGTIHTNGQANVAINTKVGATFSKVMNPLTITNASFTLTQTATGAPVAGTVSYTGVSALFIPASNLAPSTSYTVTVKGGTGGVTDLAGNPMKNDFVISWTTGLAADVVPPTVTGTIQTNGQINVAINSKVGATFSKGMDHLTITNVNFTVKETVTGNAVAGLVSYSGVNTVFIPASNLAPSTGYTVTIKGGTGGVTDLAGNPMTSDFVWSWTTGLASDITPPTVTGTINANGATNVAINTKVGATFSEAMDPLTITNVNYTLTQTATGTPVAGTVSYSGVSAAFIPLSSLAPNTGYTVTIKGGVNGVKSLEGNPMTSDFVISWTTGAAPDTTPPTVIGTINANGAINVAINTKAGATFSKGMNPLTITNVNLTLKQTATGASVAGTVSYSGVNAVFIPLSNLAPSTGYTVTVKGGAGGVTDLAGNALVSDYVWSWTTGLAPDTTPPTVTGTVNANNASNVSTNTNEGATFSKGMNPLTITNVNFTLQQTATGAPVAGTVSYAGVNASFIPLSSLAYSTNYTATIKGNSGGVTDLAGNAMVSDYVWNWTTGHAPVTTPPVTPPAAVASGGVCAGAGCVNIGTASKYVILAKAGVSSAPNSVVTGNVGVSPAARGSLTGWSLIGEPTDTAYSSAQVTGSLYAADMVGGTTSVDLGAAVLDMGTAYTAATGMPTAGGGLPAGGPHECPGVGAMSDVNDALALGGSFPATGLPAGVYTCAVDVTIPGTLTLNGTATDIWVFKITGKLTQANGIHVNLTGGALAKNVFWQVSGVVTIGTTALMQGVILAQTNIAVQTGATVIGRLLAQTAVTLDTATITAP